MRTRAGKRAGTGAGMRGLTLIELVVAMAIFALVAVMGLQSLTGSMRMRDRLLTLDAQTGALGQTLALLRHDLQALVPMLFYPPGGSPRSAIDLSRDGGTLSLSLDGQPVLPPQTGPGMARAQWHHDPATARLSRQVWPTLFPASAAVAAPDVVALEGVTALRLRSYWEGIGWVPGVQSTVPVAAAELGSDSDGGQSRVAESYSSALPLAIELVLETRDFGSIRLLETLQ